MQSASLYSGLGKVFWRIKKKKKRNVCKTYRLSLCGAAWVAKMLNQKTKRSKAGQLYYLQLSIIEGFGTTFQQIFHLYQHYFYFSGPNICFSLQGRHVAPINVKLGKGSAAPRAKFHVYKGRNVGIQPSKLSKFRTLAINLPLRVTRLQSLYGILKFCTRL